MVLSEIHQAEENALQATLQHYSPDFIEALEHYAKTFQQALSREKSTDE